MEVRVNNISYAYSGNVVFDAASFTLHPQKIYGLIGENGAGKTTLISILAGIQQSPTGEMINVSNPGLLLQGVDLYQNLSVMENLQYFALEKGLAFNEVEQVLAFTKFPSSHHPKKYKHLSQGYKKRLAIALSFLTKGNLVLLDEPFSTVDIPTIRVLKKALREFVAQTGKTVLISSHQLKEVRDLLDEVLLIKERKVVAVEAAPHPSVHQIVLYFDCKDHTAITQLLEMDSRFRLLRKIDQTYEIALVQNCSASDFISKVEEVGLAWSKIEKQPPLEFLFYSTDNDDQ
ncbi:MAG: ATP-binding cassette domain-containing protein [Salibacteraceae bacterium]